MKFQTLKSIFHFSAQRHNPGPVLFLMMFIMFIFSPRSCNALFHEQFNFPPRFPPQPSISKQAWSWGTIKRRRRRKSPRSGSHLRPQHMAERRSAPNNRAREKFGFTLVFFLPPISFYSCCIILVDSVLHFSPLNIFFNKLPCVPIEVHNSDPTIIWSLYCPCWVCVNSK